MLFELGLNYSEWLTQLSAEDKTDWYVLDHSLLCSGIIYTSAKAICILIKE